MKIHETKWDRLVTGIIYLLVFLCAIICIYPLYLVLINSFSDPIQVASGNVLLWIKGFTLDGYKMALEDSSIVTGYLNSLFYLIAGTTVNLLLTIPAAYALSKNRLFGRKTISLLIIFTMYFSGGTIPTYLVFRGLGLLNTRWAVLLSGAVSTSNLIIARTFFANSVPKELEEAAEIDGASTLQTFLQVVLPLSKAMIGVLTLYYAVARWNSYIPSLYYQARSPEMWPLQMILRKILLLANKVAEFDPEMADYYASLANQMKYAVVVLASVPLLVIYPFIQKYFDKGIMMGSLKG